MMSKEKWIASLLDDMVESQWSDDIINREFERISQLTEKEEMKRAEDLEPINQFSSRELIEQERQHEDFKAQIESFSKSDYEDYLISQAVHDIRREGCFEEIEFSDEYLEDMIRQHLEEERDFLDMVMKEAIAEEDYFQDYVERRIYEEHVPDYQDYSDEEDFYIVEYPVEKDVFDDLGDTSYLDQGIYEGADTDGLEEPFRYVYYEEVLFDDFDDDYFNVDSEDFYDGSTDFIDIASAPDDLTLEEPADDVEDLIRERLFEERYLDRIFVEIIKRDDYWDRIIREKLESDERLDAKIRGLG